MVLIICTMNESNLTNRYCDMVPDGQKMWTDRMDGRRQNYIPPTSSGDNKAFRDRDKLIFRVKLWILSYPSVLTYVLGTQKNRLIETVFF